VVWRHFVRSTKKEHQPFVAKNKNDMKAVKESRKVKKVYKKVQLPLVLSINVPKILVKKCRSFFEIPMGTF